MMGSYDLRYGEYSFLGEGARRQHAPASNAGRGGGNSVGPSVTLPLLHRRTDAQLGDMLVWLAQLGEVRDTSVPTNRSWFLSVEHYDALGGWPIESLPPTEDPEDRDAPIWIDIEDELGIDLRFNSTGWAWCGRLGA